MTRWMLPGICILADAFHYFSEHRTGYCGISFLKFCCSSNLISSKLAPYQRC
uniref:Uncharacterized protein n=1 Tax=Arundo donax TaxID=35708 RepID=A0A0A9FTK1_ARUDO